MIEGEITAEGVPAVLIAIAGRSWPAIVDTGFNADLGLPTSLQPFVNKRFLCRNRSLLAAGQIVEEDSISSSSHSTVKPGSRRPLLHPVLRFSLEQTCCENIALRSISRPEHFVWITSIDRDLVAA